MWLIVEGRKGGFLDFQKCKFLFRNRESSFRVYYFFQIVYNKISLKPILFSITIRLVTNQFKYRHSTTHHHRSIYIYIYQYRRYNKPTHTPYWQPRSYISIAMNWSTRYICWLYRAKCIEVIVLLSGFHKHFTTPGAWPFAYAHREHATVKYSILALLCVCVCVSSIVTFWCCALKCVCGICIIILFVSRRCVCVWRVRMWYELLIRLNQPAAAK